MHEFRDKIVFMTGGGSGIGKSISQALARQGARIIVTNNRAETAVTVADGVRPGASRKNPSAA